MYYEKTDKTIPVIVIAATLFALLTGIVIKTNLITILPELFLVFTCFFSYFRNVKINHILLVLATLCYICCILLYRMAIFHYEPTTFLIQILIYYCGSFIMIFLVRKLNTYKTTIEQKIQSTNDLLKVVEVKKSDIEKASYSKSEFLINTSHEIRTSMNVICGMAEILSQSPAINALDMEYVNTIQTASHTLLDTINDIHDYSKIEVGKLELLDAKYNLVCCVNDVKSIISSHIADKNISFCIDINPQIPYLLYGDEIRVRQIMLNLLMNALNFTDSGYICLNIDFEKIDDESIFLNINIIDSGETSGSDKQPTDGALSDYSNFKHRESGLSLDITRYLARFMGGNLTRKIVSGEGRTFRVSLKQKMYDGRPFTPSIDFAKYQLLIYEPDSYYLQSMTTLLISLGIAHKTYPAPEDLLADIVDSANTYIFFDYASGIHILRDVLNTLKLTTPVTLLDRHANFQALDQQLLFLHKPLNLFTFIPILELKINPELKNIITPINKFTAPDARILIVDDNRINLKVVQGLIQPFQCSITLASSGNEALTLLNRGEIYDIIFMDYMMPTMDGLETVKLIRQIPTQYTQEVPIIALTANTVKGAKEMFLENGMNGFLPKPIKITELNAIMAKWIPQEKISGNHSENMLNY